MGTHNFTERDRKKQADWIRKVIGTESARSFAYRTGIPSRTVHGWTERGRIPAEGVLRVSEVEGYDPIQALIDTGFLEEREDDTYRDENALFGFSSQELVDELARRFSPEIGVALNALISAAEKK